MQNTRRKVLSTALYLWLSFTLHVYAFYIAGLSPSFQDALARFRAENTKKEFKIRNIILETAEEQSPPEETAFISDKNTLNASPVFDTTKPQDYNNAASLRPPASGKADTEKARPAQGAGRLQTQPMQAGGQGAPFYFDPDKAPVVNLYNNGNLSVAAEARDYAKYFLEMQKKIGTYHKEFFPVYQYYQGLLRDGVVIVDFMIDKNGNVVYAEIVSSYGSDTVDKASLNSILYAKNFGPLPPDLAKEGPVKIRFHFVYFAR